MRRSDHVKRIMKAVLFIGIFVLLMKIFDCAFELDEGATERMLTSYSETADIDTVFVGNSAGEMVLADEYSALSGDRAFNMCTPSQGLSVSLKNIRLAFSHHAIKKAILLVTPDTVNSESYDAIDHVYDRVVDSSSPFFVRLKNSFARNFRKSFSSDIIDTERSVNIWIPWENEKNHGFDNVKENLTRRIGRLVSGNSPGSHIAFDLNTKNHEARPGTLSDEDMALLHDDIESIESLSIPEGMLSDDKVTLLADICSFCRDNDISLTVIVTPHRSDYYDRYEQFRNSSDSLSLYLNDFISKRGFVYYNTEDDPDLHTILPDEYFYDWEHVSDPYRSEATSYLSNIIMTKEE